MNFAEMGVSGCQPISTKSLISRVRRVPRAPNAWRGQHGLKTNGEACEHFLELLVLRRRGGRARRVRPGDTAEERLRIVRAAVQFVGVTFQNLACFWRARSRLHRNQIFQVNMCFAAFFKLYKICTLLHRSKVNNLANVYNLSLF